MSSEVSQSPEVAPVPCIIQVEPASAALRIAALTTLDRLLVAAHRAGLGPITVVATAPLPPIPRARAWQVPFREVRDWPSRAGLTVVLRTDVLVQPVDLRRLAAGNARLVDAAGQPLSAVCVGAGVGDPFSLEERLPDLRSEGVACRAGTASEARAAGDALWASIRSSADGLVDRYFNRPAGRPFSRALVHTPVTPNMISVSATLLGLVAAALFAVGETRWSVVAGVLFQISAVLDCMDGDVARVAFKESPLGKWLDIVGDQVVHIGVFAGIAAGVMRSGGGTHAVWLGALAVVGAAMSFWMVMRGMRFQKDGKGGGAVERLMDAATNRDFSVLVLALACVDRLGWFLWMAGLGSHVFWVVLWALQRGKAPRPGAPI